FVVTNLSGHGPGIDHGFYGQRGDVPEKPMGQLKNGLQMDRWSFHRFRAHGLKLLEHTLASALVVRHREAPAALPEIARAEVRTLRQKWWTVGAVVTTSVRPIGFHFAETWPHRDLFVRGGPAVQYFVASLRQPASSAGPRAGLLPLAEPARKFRTAAGRWP